MALVDEEISELKRLTASIAMLAFTVSAHAEGFEINDLTNVAKSVRTLPGNAFADRTDAQRMTLTCLDCGELVAIDFLLAKSTDGTEGRFRSGETTMAQMEKLCRERDSSCRMEQISVGPGIGWHSVWSGGSTAILFRDGDMLTIRAIADTPENAANYVTKALESVAPAVVGR